MKYRALFRTFVVTMTRLFLGGIFFTGGISKLMPFPGVMGPVWLEEELEPHGLGMYARFIAWSELIIGLLLLSMRFATVGAIMLVPLLLNILMVTVSMKWQGTPYVIVFFLVLNGILLVHDYPRWRFLFIDTTTPHDVPFERRMPVADAISLAAFAAIVAGPLLYPLHATIAYTVVGVGFATLFVAAALHARRPASA